MFSIKKFTRISHFFFNLATYVLAKIGVYRVCVQQNILFNLIKIIYQIRVFLLVIDNVVIFLNCLRF